MNNKFHFEYNTVEEIDCFGMSQKLNKFGKINMCWNI